MGEYLKQRLSALAASARRTSLLVHLAVLATYALAAALSFAPLLRVGLDAEESLWLRGEILGSPLRLTAHHLLRDVLLPLLGPNLFGYRLSTFIIHFANAALVYFFVRAMAGRLLGERPLPVHLQTLGAAAAGFLFMVHANNAVNRVHCLSYLLAVFFSLCALLLAVAYFKRTHILLWVLVLVAYTLSLLSNLQTYGLPLVFACIEFGWMRDRASPRKVWTVVARYAALLAVFALCLMGFWDSVFDMGTHELSSSARSGELFFFPRYLLVVLVFFFPGLGMIPFALSDGNWGPLGVIILVALGLFGARQIVSGKRAGLLGVGATFILLWSGLVFPLLLTVTWVANPHRFYFTAVGFAVFFGVCVMFGLARAPERVKRIPLRTLLAVVAAAVCVLAWIGDVTQRQRVAMTLSGELNLTYPQTWRRCIHCPSMEPVSAAQFIRRAGQGQALRCSDLGKEVLQGFNLPGVDLHGSSLIASRLIKAQLPKADLRHATLLWSRIHGSNLDGSSMAGADLSGVELMGSTMVGADLRGSNLQWVRFHQSNLSRARLDGANLQMATLADCDLKGANLNDVDLRTARLFRSDLRGATLQGVLFKGSIMVGARYDDKTVFPVGFDPARAGMEKVPVAPSTER